MLTSRNSNRDERGWLKTRSRRSLNHGSAELVDKRYAGRIVGLGSRCHLHQPDFNGMNMHDCMHDHPRSSMISRRLLEV